jgi:hypothetical protein
MGKEYAWMMERHVQASLSERTHDRLRRRARQENRPIKDIVREAVELYLQRHEGKDPLDDLIGSVDLGGGWSTRKDWRDPFQEHKDRTRGR